MKNLKTQLAVLLLSTLCLLTAAYGQLTPSGDAYTSTAAPTTNYGTSKLLDVESSQTTYIQFNLSSIPAGYTSADITKATLKLYVNTATKAGSFNVDYVNGAWSESTLDASNAPALGTTIQASVPITTADKNQYILIDITAAVQAWLSGTANDGIALVGNSPVDATFDSKESTTTSHPPELDIVFAGSGGSGITGITTAAGSGLIGGGTSGTLNLSLTNTCAKNQVLQWSGSAWACASAGTGTITGVTAGTDLTGGGTSGNVTLSLNTSATNGLYAQLAAANTFTANQTVNGNIVADASTLGVLGEANATSGGTVGVGGLAASAAGYGVEGLNTAVGGTGVFGTAPQFGVYGIATGSGNTVGVFGAGADGLQGSGTIHGVYAASAGATGYGVEGVNTGSGAAGGFFNNGNSPALLASNSAPYPSNPYAGIIGVEGLSANVGVYGASDGASGQGTGFGAVGVWGDTGNSGDGYFAVLGTADDGYAGAFYNNSGSFTTTTLYAVNNETSNTTAEVFSASGGMIGGTCTMNVSGDLTCSGKVTEIVNAEGARKVALYSMQSPENWFEDFGSGALSNGAATITLDPTFSQTVNTGTEYHVFLTAKGDCKGLYVANESATGFEVRELSGGTSDVGFDYRIVAKRVGYENVRLADLTEQFNKQEAQRQKMRRPARPSAAPQSGPKMPVSPALAVRVAMQPEADQPK
jgi:hypothetical protein